MIDFRKAQKAFKEYVENYDKNNVGIERKIKHTYGVVEKSEEIAKDLGLSQENIELAKLIALLHDIGRFEQIKLVEEMNDAKIDHAEYGIKILFQDGLIRNFVEDNQYDTIIYKAILNHNKYKIEEGLSNVELLHSKIIRDADKLDNFRLRETYELKKLFPKTYKEETIEYETISLKVYEDFMKHQCILAEDIKTILDNWICLLAFIFDLNFAVSIQDVKEHQYIDKLIDRIEYKNNDTKQKMEQIRKCAKEYLDRKYNKK